MWTNFHHMNAISEHTAAMQMTGAICGSLSVVVFGGVTLKRAARLYAAWVLAMILHILLRIALAFCIPIIFIWSGYGMNWNKRSAQASFDMTCLFQLRWPRFPSVSLAALAKQARRRSADHGIAAKKPGKAVPFSE